MSCEAVWRLRPPLPDLTFNSPSLPPHGPSVEPAPSPLPPRPPPPPPSAASVSPALVPGYTTAVHTHAALEVTVIMVGGGA